MRGLRSNTKRPAVLLVALTTLVGSVVCRTEAWAQCRGDCDGNGQTTVDEIVTLVNIALGTIAVINCTGGDVNGDGRITVDEILSAVTDALSGCPVATTWQQIDPTTGLQDIWGVSIDDIFVVGGDGVVLHYNGDGWAPMNSGTSFTLLAVWGLAADDVYAVGFNPLSSSNPALQRGIILHYDGESWTEVQHGQTDTFFRDVWASAPDDVFVVGGREGFGTPGVILHYNGETWTQQLLVNDSQPHNQLRGVWGFGPDDVYAVGSGQAPLEGSPGMPALAFHYDGDVWLRMPAMSGVFNTVWGPQPGDVYASGGPTGLAHFNGQMWSAFDTDLFSQGTTFPIWGFGPQDIFFGLFHYDGESFELTREPESLLFEVDGLWGPPDGSVIFGAAPNGVWKLER
jgi:hypothetical protein